MFTHGHITFHTTSLGLKVESVKKTFFSVEHNGSLEESEEMV